MTSQILFAHLIQIDRFASVVVQRINEIEIGQKVRVISLISAGLGEHDPEMEQLVVSVEHLIADVISSGSAPPQGYLWTRSIPWVSLQPTKLAVFPVLNWEKRVNLRVKQLQECGARPLIQFELCGKVHFFMPTNSHFSLPPRSKVTKLWTIDHTSDRMIDIPSPILCDIWQLQSLTLQ